MESCVGVPAAYVVGVEDSPAFEGAPLKPVSTSWDFRSDAPGKPPSWVGSLRHSEKGADTASSITFPIKFKGIPEYGAFLYWNYPYHISRQVSVDVSLHDPQLSRLRFNLRHATD